MKKEYILILAALVIIFLGWYAVSSGLVNPRHNAAATPGGAQGGPSGSSYFWADEGKWKVMDAGLSYDKASGRATKLHFEYPRDFDLFYGDNGGVVSELADPSLGKLSVAFPADAFRDPMTNFGVGGVSFSATNTSTAQCFDPIENGVKFEGTEDVNGLTFRLATSSDAAAGTAYQNEVYRALTNGICLEVDLTLGMANIGNFDPSMHVEELDPRKPSAVLHDILRTVRVTQEAP